MQDKERANINIQYTLIITKCKYNMHLIGKYFFAYMAFLFIVERKKYGYCVYYVSVCDAYRMLAAKLHKKTLYAYK
jgi:hypothetical protein